MIGFALPAMLRFFNNLYIAYKLEDNEERYDRKLRKKTPLKNKASA